MKLNWPAIIDLRNSPKTIFINATFQLFFVNTFENIFELPDKFPLVRVSWPGLAMWPIRWGQANKQRNESDCKSFAQPAASLTLKICQVLFANCNGMWQVGAGA